MSENMKWEWWIMEAVNNIPTGVSLADAIKAEEVLKNLYKEITGQTL